MGIPQYYKHIITKYKGIVKDVVPRCDRMYIDFNSVIHTCAATVVRAKPLFTHSDIIDSIIAQTESVIAAMSPSELVFIGIDGVAPRAKMVQQRKRRYITAFRNEAVRNAYERNMIKLPPAWDSNTITPGTPFMDELDRRLEAHFDGRRDTPCKVIVSGSRVPGEGEQKLFDHMLACNDGKTNVVNGLDADLIMLSLLSDQSVFLQRDDTTYVDISEFRRCIAYHVDPSKPTANLMWDYVFLCFLLGNDFVPGVPFLKIRDGAIDLLLDMYKRACCQKGEVLVTYDVHKKEYGVNTDALKEIIRALAEAEKENMDYALRKHSETESVRGFVPGIPEDCPKSLRRFYAELEQYPLVNKHPLLALKSSMWNSHYYEEFFGSHDPKMSKRYCEQYIDGLLWVMNYYFNRRYDSLWHFRYPVAPLADDLYKTMLVTDEAYIKGRTRTLMEESSSVKLSPELQLLCVTPRTSAGILPPWLSEVMLDTRLGCVHFFPTEFRLCTFMKRFLWECTPILPEIDIKLLEQTIQNQSSRARS